MKILVLQLARLGDIYMSWPGLRALRRQYPEAEIHLLTRPRFEAAVEGLTAIDQHLSLPSLHVLSPLVQDQPNDQDALLRMAEWVTELKEKKYDWVINLTFSPFSSYLTHAIANGEREVKVSGYTRYADGSLAFGDELSAYFYAQVGFDRQNRVHLSDLFASLMDVQFIEEDWAAPFIPTRDLHLPPNFIAIHVGASEAHKSVSPSFWGDTVRHLLQVLPETSVVLIGSAAEKDLAAWVKAAVPSPRVVDMVGKTQVVELFTVLQQAQLLIGPDSAPLHMASLTETPTLNLSLGNVNFWQTGPKASLSFILKAEKENQLSPNKVAQMVGELMQGNLPAELIVRAGGMTSYDPRGADPTDFQWQLIQAIYMHGAYPMADKMSIIDGALKLDEINTFAQEQLEQVPRRGVEAVAPFLARAEEIIESISRVVPELSPLINWYQAEKVRIGPGTQQEVLAATLNVHQNLSRHLKVYLPTDLMEEGVNDGAL